MNRRDFLSKSAAVSAAAILGSARVYAAGNDNLKIGLIGAGSRGCGAAINALQSTRGLEIVAIGDVFADRIESGLAKIKEKMEKEKIAPEALTVTCESSFTGFDAYQKVIDYPGIDLLIIATPPHFRPQHFKAAVEAGKHVFMEKPVAVDPAGVRSIIESAKIAQSKKLSVVAGTQRRHQVHYLEMMKRVNGGDIGELVGGQCYWMQGELWVEKAAENWKKYKEEGLSDMEWQLRNWLFCTWLSGDHIVEQHVHNIDIMNWAFGGHPVKAIGMGGRVARTDPMFGNIYDHFAVEYEYANGARISSMCRQIKGATDRVSERVVGTKGVCITDRTCGEIEGENEYEWEWDVGHGMLPNPYVQEHADLINAIRMDTPINEAERVAESTMTAILGRMSAYTGREIKYKWALKASKLDLTPAEYKLGSIELAPPAVPGQTKLI
jgi:predicted dehydrogenase